MTKRLNFLCLLSALLLGGCATKNDSGVVLYKKPDLSKVAPGTPVSKVASLKKPIKREVITKGELKGAEAWLFEWDAPNDEVNNKMYTSVVVKDGAVVAYVEDSPDKWRKDPQLYKAAKLQSAFEDLSSSMARAAQYQAAANFASSYGAAMANRAASAPMQAYNNAYASSYKPWETAPSTVNYGMVGGGPIPFGAQQITSTSQSTSTAPQKVYPTWGISGARDITKGQSGVVQDGKVYPTWGISGARDITKGQSGVVQDGKVYATVPGTGMRDISKIAPSGVIE